MEEKILVSQWKPGAGCEGRAERRGKAERMVCYRVGAEIWGLDLEERPKW